MPESPGSLAFVLDNWEGAARNLTQKAPSGWPARGAHVAKSLIRKLQWRAPLANDIAQRDKLGFVHGALLLKFILFVRTRKL
jgi:hypothetical protein